jgi:hypothetical protein
MVAAVAGRYGAHVIVDRIPESRHSLAYGICVVGDHGLLIAHSDGDRAVAVRTNDPYDVAALRDLLRPYWETRSRSPRRPGGAPQSPSPAAPRGPSVG